LPRFIPDADRSVTYEFAMEQVEFRRSRGEPNWNATCGIANPMIVKAFVTAVVKAQISTSISAWRSDQRSAFGFI
jgi:hypothetical protein